MQTIRSFIAVPLADDVSRSAVNLIERIRQPNDGIKWVPTDNLHLTLKFLGDVDNVEVPDVCAAVQKVAAEFDPFELVFSGTGGFPSLDRPRILYAGIQDESGRLVELVSRLEEELADLRFKPEPRDYRPHLTIGRTRSNRGLAESAVVDRLKENAETELGVMAVDTIQMFASFLDKGGPTYQVMDTIYL